MKNNFTAIEVILLAILVLVGIGNICSIQATGVKIRVVKEQPNWLFKAYSTCLNETETSSELKVCIANRILTEKN